jgi:hypothetical protein
LRKAFLLLLLFDVVYSNSPDNTFVSSMLASTEAMDIKGPSCPVKFTIDSFDLHRSNKSFLLTSIAIALNPLD